MQFSWTQKSAPDGWVQSLQWFNSVLLARSCLVEKRASGTDDSHGCSKDTHFNCCTFWSLRIKKPNNSHLKTCKMTSATTWRQGMPASKYYIIEKLIRAMKNHFSLRVQETQWVLVSFFRICAPEVSMIFFSFLLFISPFVFLFEVFFCLFNNQIYLINLNCLKHLQ